MASDLEKYISFFFNFDNPVFFSFFLMVTILFIIIIFVKYVVVPLQQKHIFEKKELEIKNVKLMALFSELDPDPVFRINKKGIILLSNNAAKGLFPSLEGKHFNELLPSIDINIESSITNNSSYSFYNSIGNKFFSILFRGISYLDIAQVYLHDVTERKLYEDKLLDYQNRLNELTARQQREIEEERQRISRELHDGIGQNILLIKMQLLKYSHLFKNGSFEDFQNTISMLETTVVELKGISYKLKPKLLEEMGLAPALKSLCKIVSAESKIISNIDIDQPEKRLDTMKELSLYRIAQEILNNIIKHSQAKQFDMQLINTDESVQLIISDNGIGFEPEDMEHPTGMGLLNIKQRVESYKGKLKIDSNPGNGTVFIVEIPTEIKE
jgi:signal transduction histidine kinase